MPEEFTLDMAPENSSLKITGITAQGRNRLRLLQLGITPGAYIKVIRLAPLADPVEIVVRGTKLALRRDEANAIKVVRTDEK